MKDIAEVRKSLARIPYALGDNVPPQAPVFGGTAKAVRADLCDFEELDDGASDTRADLRDAESLFSQLDKSVDQRGIDALAWYHPFHLHPDKWGIYVPTTSLHYVAERWFDRRMRLSRRASLALDVLLAHEVMHHACEYAVAQFEIFLCAPCWAPARERLNRAKLEWFNDEEALANANVIRWLATIEPRVPADRVHAALLRSPPGYRDFSSALSDDGFDDHILEVLRHNVGIPAADLKTGFLNPAFDVLRTFPEFEEARASCHICLVSDTGRFALPALSPRIVTSIPHIVETDRFKKMFRKLGPHEQEDWARTKKALADAVPRHPKFKKLKGGLRGLWGVYLNGGFRAHIRPAPNGIWEAIEIGSHKRMGHE